MTPEETFEIWWVDVGAPHVLSPKYSSKDDLKAAWLEATRQAYEDAARMCEGQEQEDCDGELNIYRECAKAIRAKLKELDNGN